MIGLGTIINVAAIIVGGLIGLIFSRVISARYQETLMQANGVCVLFVGISGTIQEMMSVRIRRSGIGRELRRFIVSSAAFSYMLF